MAKRQKQTSAIKPKIVTYYTIQYYTCNAWYDLGSTYLGVKGFDEYSSDGECYKQTGEIGVFDKEYAIAYMEALKQAYYNHTLFSLGYSHTEIWGFRVVEVTTVTTSQVVESWTD